MTNYTKTARELEKTIEALDRIITKCEALPEYRSRADYNTHAAAVHNVNRLITAFEILKSIKLEGATV